MALKSETASPPDGMVEVIDHKSGDGEDLEDGEIFDDEDDGTPAGVGVPADPPPPPIISEAADEKKKPIRKPPVRQRRPKRLREEERLFRNNKIRRKSEEGDKPREKDLLSDEDDMDDLSPLRLDQDWERGHHRPGFGDELDDEEDEVGRRNRGFGNRNRRGRNRGGGGRRGMGRRDNGQICKFFLQAKCQRGSECPFNHAQRKYEVCRFYLNDCCAKKDRCLFLHSEFPCKYHYLGMKCYAGKKCKFSHAKLSSQMRANLLRDSKECEFLQHIDSPPPEGKTRRERERESKSESRERHRGKEKNKKKAKEREREKKEREERDKERFTLHFKVDPRTISDEEEGNRTPMPSPTHANSTDRDSHSISRSRSRSRSRTRSHSPQSVRKKENMAKPEPQPEKEQPKDNGVSEELPDFIPPDLPKHQRELYKRIQQQQREAATLKTDDEEEEKEEKEDKEKEADDYKEEDWYSSEEEDTTKNPLAILLNKLKQQQQPKHPSPPTPPPPPIIVPPILPDIDISAVSKLLSTVRETIQQKQQISEAATATATRPPLLPTPSVSLQPTIPPLLPSLSLGSSSVPNLNPLSEPAPSTEKRRMRDPRLRGNSTEEDVDLRMGGRSDVDLRQLPFKPAPAHAPASEIDASVTSHPPVVYRLIPISPPPPPDYSNVHSKNVNDPRLKRHLNVGLGVSMMGDVPPLLPTPMGPPLRPAADVPRDPRQRMMVPNDPRRKSSLLLQRDSDLRNPAQSFSHINDVDLRMHHPPPPHLAFK